jgi:LacI family transcriptional regulator
MSTIRDVAQIAGVSIATVSRVLNGSNRVSEETCRRVWAAATQLDYWPNAAARALTTRKAHTIGILLPDLYGEFYSELIRGVDQTARKQGFQILLSSSHGEAKTILGSARSMLGRVEGLIIMAPHRDSSEALLQISKRFPTVLLNPGVDVPGCSSVAVPNFDSAQALIRHLLRLGHQSIAIIKGPSSNVDAEERLRGFLKAVVDQGIEPEARMELQGDFTEVSGFQAATQLLRMDKLPDSIFAANDSMAVGALSALGAAGVKIPEDVAIVGFDDISIAQFVTPALTTVQTDAFGMGERAVDLLIASIQDPAQTGVVNEVLPAPLVIRKSCGANAEWGQASLHLGDSETRFAAG